MGRRIRCVPGAGTLVAVTCRAMQGRFLFRPSAELNDLVLGVLGRAQRLHAVVVCGVTVLSNHLHLLVIVDDAKQLADFMEYLCSNLAREINRLTGWNGPVFQGRYSMIVVTEEEEAQVERFQYLLAQGCKENLVARLRDWPGVHCIGALVDGIGLAGHWIDRTREYSARRRGRAVTGQPFATEETLTLAPLPCWRHMTPEAYRDRVAELVEAIERDAAIERKRAGVHPLGRSAILMQHPHYRPTAVARSPAPLVHAASQAARRAFRESYGAFVDAFRYAAETLRRGDQSACFPPGSFPPGLPFVPLR